MIIFIILKILNENSHINKLFLKKSLKEKHLFPDSKVSSEIRWASWLFPSEE